MPPASVSKIFEGPFLEPGDPASRPDVPTKAVHTAGFAAAAAFAEDIAGWTQYVDEELMLSSLGAFIEKAGTGGGLFRRLLAQGALEIAQMTGDEATASLARSADRAADAWTSVARAATIRDQPAHERVRHSAESDWALPGLESTLTQC